MRVEILNPIRVGDDPVFLIHDLLSPQECKALIQAAEEVSFEAAADYCYMYRNRMNDRLMSDDVAFSELLWPSVREILQTNLTEEQQRSLETPCWSFAKKVGVPHPHSLNHRWRYCRYTKLHYFGAHVDGGFRPTPDVRSLLTFMLYLNGPPEHTGGCTNFLDIRTKQKTLTIEPKAGTAIVFPQENSNYYHEGEVLTSGVKYILRSDIMFSQTGPQS